MDRPWNARSKQTSQLMLWRLPDENFRVMQVGGMPLLIHGYQHVLVHQSILTPFLSLDKEQVSIYPRTILNHVTHRQWTTYSELVITHSITTESIRQLEDSSIQIWQFNAQHLFVSSPLKAALEKITKQLDFSIGFSHFG